MSEFYAIFARKIPEFYVIIARTIFFRILGKHLPPCLRGLLCLVNGAEITKRHRGAK